MWPADFVVEAPGVFDDETCDWLLGLVDERTQVDGVVARRAGEGPIVDEDVRRVRQNVVPQAIAPAVYERVVAVADECNRQWFGFDLDGVDEELILVDYGPGDFYNWHLDGGPAAPTRKLSMSILLSSPADYTGGALTFPGRVVDAVPRGSAVVFPSFLLHGVQPVKTGRRRALLAWVGGPPFR